jgi:hypothetical protein
MDYLKRHAIWTAIAVAVGIAGIAWLQPTTSGGTMLVMVISLIIFNAVAAAGSASKRPARSTAAPDNSGRANSASGPRTRTDEWP